MKKILFAAFAATLLAAGCQKTEVIGLENGQDGLAMTFSTEMKKITKADELETLATNSGFENLVSQGFNVWAYADFDITNSTNVDKATGIFDGMENWYIEGSPNEAVTAATWSARKQFYWPGKDKKLQFFAVSAEKKNTVSPPTDNPKPISYTVDIKPKFTANSKIESDSQAPMMTISGFTVAQDANEDLMVADFLTQDQESKEANGTAGKVALNFRHTLSKVEFVFKTTSDASAPPVYIQKLEVTKLNNSGTLSVTPASSTPTTTATNVPVTTVVTPKWTGQGGAITFGKISETSIPLESGKTLDYLMTEDGDDYVYENANGELLSANPTEAYVTWLMMPQTLSLQSQIEVIYVIKDRQFKAIFPLIANDKTTKNPIDKWEENKYTKYTITLSPNLISFDADVSEDWDDANEIEHQN